VLIDVSTDQFLADSAIQVHFSGGLLRQLQLVPVSFDEGSSKLETTSRTGRFLVSAAFGRVWPASMNENNSERTIMNKGAGVNFLALTL
jgi:hypothetical protein